MVFRFNNFLPEYSECAKGYKQLVAIQGSRRDVCC